MADTPAGSHAHAHTSPEAPSSAVTRSQFLTLSSVGLGAAIGAVIGVPAAAYVLAPVTEESTFEPVFLGKTDTFPQGPQGQFKPVAAQYIDSPPPHKLVASEAQGTTPARTGPSSSSRAVTTSAARTRSPSGEFLTPR